MTLLFTSLIIITCILLVIIVLVQNPKGGGLSSSFGGSGTQLFGGVKKTTDFLDRGTWTLAIVLVALVLGMSVAISPASSTEVQTEESELQDMPAATAPQQSAPAVDPATMPQSVDEENGGEE